MQCCSRMWIAIYLNIVLEHFSEGISNNIYNFQLSDSSKLFGTLNCLRRWNSIRTAVVNLAPLKI